MIKQFPPITKPLLDWYDKQARILPWRENPEPYFVWLSEIMLQQTRVEAGRPYFQRFVSVLPTIEALANAPEELLLKLWEGLGYYNRVRNLQKAAKIIMERYHGELPADYALLQTLPGIGEYTAGAIASIAYRLPVPAVDGNVLRVYARLAADDCNIQDKEVKRAVGEAVLAVQPPERCGDFNQSLMELGAVVCLPNGQPKCDLCPVADLCLAHAQGIALSLPVKRPKTARKQEDKTVFLLFSGDRVAVRKRSDQGLLAGLWEFPNVPGQLSGVAASEALATAGIGVPELSYCGDAKHIFSHIEWHMVGYCGLCSNRTEGNGLRWVTREEFERTISLPSAFKVFADLARENWPEDPFDFFGKKS